MSCWGRGKRRLWKFWISECEGCSVVAHLDSVQKVIIKLDSCTSFYRHVGSTWTPLDLLSINHKSQDGQCIKRSC
jgi:hypothetical protein